MFTHLHLHTDGSFMDAVIKIDKLAEKLQELNMDSCAITDHGSLTKAVEFWKILKKNKIKPIIGCEMYITNDINIKSDDSRKNHHLILLSKNYEGYQNLIKLNNIAYDKGYYYKPRIDKKILLQYSKGLIALSACLKGEIPDLLINSKDTTNTLNEYLAIFRNDFYIEIQPHPGYEKQNKINKELIELANRRSIPIVATNDCHYINPEDEKIHDMILCIKDKKILSDKDRFIYETKDLYVKSEEQMLKEINNQEYLNNTYEIAKKCNFDYKTDKYRFPYIPNAEKDFEFETRRGYIKLRFNNQDVIENTQLYDERLEKEINVIKKSGFSDYMLIVKDFIQYCEQNNIPTGPGRGSAVGSLVSYCLGITKLDPIKYGLLFERFLNPERISLPDIDSDFCINGRSKVLEYVYEKYKNVCQISTVMNLFPKSALKDAGRILGIPFNELNEITKKIDNKDDITDFKNKYPELFDNAEKLTGITRQKGIHAAGVIISDDISDIPLRKEGELFVSEYDAYDLEDIKYVKFDFLGLKTLTVIQLCLNYIKENHNESINVYKINTDDPKTTKIFETGDTMGVFQFKQESITELAKKIKPKNFKELIPILALYRPGPIKSGMLNDYVERVKGNKPIEYIDPILEPILKETYGLIVYQEQIMEIAVKVAGFTIGESDTLRKGIGKKQIDMIEKMKSKFMESNIISKENLGKIWDLIVQFGEYGFNKSHSAAYAYISYITAYLKAHYRKEYMAAFISYEQDISQTHIKKLKIYPPDINKSKEFWTVEKDGIRVGLRHIKSIGEKAIETIIENKPYKNFEDFIEKHKHNRSITKKVIENLIKSGALDFGQPELKTEKLETYESNKNNKNNNEPLLFNIMEEEQNKNIKKDDIKQILRYELHSMGFFISENPLKNISCDNMTGVITEITLHKTKKDKKQMCYAKLMTKEDIIKLNIFNTQYEQYIDILSKSYNEIIPITITGYADTKEKENNNAEETEDKTINVKTITEFQ